MATTQNKQRKNVILPQDSNLQPLDYRTTALPRELERVSTRMLNFGYLNPANCFYYDVDNNLIVMFLMFACQSFNFELFACFWPKDYNSTLKLLPANFKNITIKLLSTS